MNILFLLKSLDTGGLEIVTSVLANKFVAEGHNVCVFSFLGGKNSIAGRLDKRVSLTIGNGYAANKGNISRMRSILIDNNVDVIINQWGLPLVPIKTACKAREGLDIKIISVYHNAPRFNGRTQKIDIKLAVCDNPVRRIALKVLRYAYKQVTSRSMRYIYEQSDLFLVLSDCYKEEFCRFTGVSDTGKLGVMTNPVTIETGCFHFDSDKKQKEIIYVGRLDFVQKRVYRVIDTWNLLEERFPDWRLTIVGDGGDRENLERHTSAMNLKRVSFEGFKSPLEYYKRASVLMLTSDFEGFPLVLAECMSLGVIPAVYNSYAAVGDIIEDGKDGIIIPFHKDGYRADEAAGLLMDIMSDDNRRSNMALAAIEKSRNYSVDSIYKEWIKRMSTL